ncbi:MAG: PAS domain-containing protein, partial [Coleofasciculus sp. S288]|nr:PAS domain-containing protein [Coleofasciculus sp. S288]
MDSEPFLALLVDRSEANYCLIRDLLKEIETIQVELDWVTTGAAVAAAMTHGACDVYLIDAQLEVGGDDHWLQVVLKQSSAFPVILLVDTPQAGIAALAAGAADYLVYAQLSAPLLERSLRLTLALAQTKRQLRECQTHYQTQTERKQAEAELRQSKLFIEAIANASPQLLYIYDLSTGCNVYVNQQIVEIWGYTPEELRQAGSQFFFNTIHPDDLHFLNE